MPRGQKRKVCSCEDSHQARDGSQRRKRAQIRTMEEEAPSTSSSLLGDIPQGSFAAGPTGTSQEPWRLPSTTITTPGIFDTRSHEDNNSQDDEYPCSLVISSSTENLCSDTLTIKARLLEKFLLYKYKMHQPITKEGMLKVIDNKHHHQFSEILRRAADRIEATFAVELKEIDSDGNFYELVSKLKLPNNGRIYAGRGLPKTGLVMTLLGVIFIKGNCVSEEDIWDFLNKMHIYAGRKHFIYGEPKKLITQDLVRLQYLEYRQIPNSDPARYEFLWGPRACAETSKMEALGFLAKIHDAVPSAFSSRYEEALQDEEESSNQSCSWAEYYHRGRACLMAKSSSFSQSY
ncbi:LOW QUALITY PROTEIN: melanoma-associated antigen B5 [Otolemur garnettii]|uniref:LOW QUALITY PROTEIN: melanoma-associated antigen B5 n=1 Tax=Otolemur garnettii TaxID=30611 RepID=UPI000C7F72AD|nr:LOW QUALITY PROTEIN: melanoma-associated antigen B5 [Otolemur garnettii]